MANYQAGRGLQNVRDAVLRPGKLTSLRKQIVSHVFKDLQVDRELVSYENHFIPIDSIQAV